MVLVNAIYFKASWLTKFKEIETKKDTFQDINGKNSEVDMMHLGDKQKLFYYDNFAAEDEGAKLPAFQLVELPYKQNEMSMVILLPRDKKGIADFERALTPEQLNHAFQNTYKREVKLWLPRFKLEQTVDLVQVLQRLGIRALFGNADLSGIAPRLTVSGAVHKAFVGITF